MCGVLMYVPLLFNPEWLSVSIKIHSIDYELVFLSDAYVSQHVLAALYAMVILIPLMLSSDRYHSVLGVMIFLSGIISVAFFDWVFISVWCYFAAIISLYIFYIMMHSSRAVSMVSIKRTR